MVSDNIISQLLIEKVTGVISEADEIYIDKLIAEDNEVHNQWIGIHTFYNSTAKQVIDNIDASAAWAKVKNKISQPQARLVQIKRSFIWSAAACVVVILSVMLLFTNKRVENKKQPIAGIKKSLPVPKPVNRFSNQIQLTLATGEELNLSDNLSKTIKTTSADVHATQHDLSFNSINNNKDVEWNILQIPAQLDYKITLADGTEVWLNSISKLRFPFSFPGSTREIFLSGEAYFKVAKNAAKPFIVHTDEADVVVHGTVFNVNTYIQNKMVVSLVEGAVTAFKKNNDSLQLKPGYEAAIFQNGKSAVQTFDESDVTAWMNGVQYFHETSLNDIAQIISRWFNTKVVFDNSHIADYTYSGVINKNKPLTEFLNNLKASSGITFNYDNQVLHFK